MRKLTKRQLEVINLVAAGSKNEDIARELGIKEHSVKMHLNRVFLTLGIDPRGPFNSRIALVRNWNCELYQRGLEELGYL